MTNYQRELFNEMLDVNWELNVSTYNAVVVKALHYRMNQLEELMGDHMGEKEWQDWKNRGREMFKSA
jgi:hypothetical protein